MTIDYAYLDELGAAQVFFPRPDPMPPPAGASDLHFKVDGDTFIGARFYPLAETQPTLLYFHGNGEVASDHDDIAPFYHDLGLNLLVAEFRGYGRSNGQPSFERLLADAHPVAEAAAEFLEQHDFTGPGLVMGRSLGSHPALELAAHGSGRFEGVIIESGSSGVARTLARLGAPESRRAADLLAAHEEKLRAIDLPVLLIHGEMDDLVPCSQAMWLQSLLGVDRCRLEVIPRAGHNDLLWRGREQYFGAIGDFVAGLPAR